MVKDHKFEVLGQTHHAPSWTVTTFYHVSRLMTQIIKNDYPAQLRPAARCCGLQRNITFSHKWVRRCYELGECTSSVKSPPTHLLLFAESGHLTRSVHLSPLVWWSWNVWPGFALLRVARFSNNTMFPVPLFCGTTVFPERGTRGSDVPYLRVSVSNKCAHAPEHAREHTRTQAGVAQAVNG